MHVLAQTYTSNSSGSSLGIFYLAIYVILAAALWRIFTKAGEEGWKAIIPIYSFIVLLKIVGRPWWWILLLLVPILNIVIYVMVTNDLSKSFGKGVGFTVGLILLPYIFYLILGFGGDRYLGLGGTGAIGGFGAQTPPPPPPPPPPAPTF